MTNRAFNSLAETGELVTLKGWQIEELKVYELNLRALGLDARFEDTVFELMQEKVSQWLKECE